AGNETTNSRTGANWAQSGSARSEQRSIATEWIPTADRGTESRLSARDADRSHQIRVIGVPVAVAELCACASGRSEVGDHLVDDSECVPSPSEPCSGPSGIVRRSPGDIDQCLPKSPPSCP